LRARGIAVLRGAEPAVDACAALTQFARARREFLSESAVTEEKPSQIYDLKEYYGVVPTLAARTLLASHGIETAACELAKNANDAVAAAERIGFPVALKIESRDIPHKTEAQGVALGLRDAAAVRAAHATILENVRRHSPRANIDGVIVQAMAESGVEMVVGLQRDPVFGTVVMAGLGGIHVEILKDVVFRPAPVTPAAAGRMLDELRGRALLDGVRGARAADRDALARLISSVSRFGAAAGERLDSLDLNPVIAGSRGAVAVDWLLLLKP
jgi:acyl-CoA synthetase (NDP forming)